MLYWFKLKNSLGAVFKLAAFAAQFAQRANLNAVRANYRVIRGGRIGFARFKTGLVLSFMRM